MGAGLGFLIVWLLLSHSSGNWLFNYQLRCCSDALVHFIGVNLTEPTVRISLSCLNDYDFMIGCVMISWLEKEQMSLALSKSVRTEWIWMLWISWWVTDRCWGQVKCFLPREINPNSNSCVLFSPTFNTGCQLGLFHLEQWRRCEIGSHVSQPAWSPVSPGNEEHKNLRHKLISWALVLLSRCFGLFVAVCGLAAELDFFLNI